MMQEDELLPAIEALLARTKETQTAFGRRVAGDASLVTDLRHGRSLGRALRQKITKAVEDGREIAAIGEAGLYD